MKLNNKVYDVLKWIVVIVLPAFIVLYETVGNVWGWPYIQQVVTTMTAIEVFLGALIGVSTISYNSEDNKEIK